MHGVGVLKIKRWLTRVLQSIREELSVMTGLPPAKDVLVR
jgi:hypothetical protein